MLQDVDSKKNCGKEELGYASMFQFYLDFFALAVTSTGIEGSQAFPVKPQEGRCYDTKSWDSRNIRSPGWKTLQDIQASLKLLYWRSHPLCDSWRCLEVPGYDDKDTWTGVSESLKAEQFGEEELLVLADAMSFWASRLEPFHKEFQLKLKARANQKRRCCIS